jgi:16S rRNA C967 or C1407 C5-methylase (RsmB/RsmF family)
LIKRGSVVVYSTNSLSPYENEAVVAAVLRRAGGSFELADISDTLAADSLVVFPGKEEWRVLVEDVPKVKKEGR